MPLRTTATLATGTTQSHDVAGLDCGTTYLFAIKGRGDGSTYSRQWGTYSYINRSTRDCPGSTPTPTPTPTPDPLPTPPAPASFTATTTGTNSVRLAWQLRSGVEQHYLTHKTTSPVGDWTRIGYLSGSTQSHDVAGLTCGRTYRFAIKGYGDGQTYTAGWGTYSRDRVTTSACHTSTPTPTPTPSLPVPPAPAGFSAAATGTVSVRLTWRTRMGVVLYYITHKEDVSDSPWQEVTRPGGTVDTYTVRGLS